MKWNLPCKCTISIAYNIIPEPSNVTKLLSISYRRNGNATNHSWLSSIYAIKHTFMAGYEGGFLGGWAVYNERYQRPVLHF